MTELPHLTDDFDLKTLHSEDRCCLTSVHLTIECAYLHKLLNVFKTFFVNRNMLLVFVLLCSAFCVLLFCYLFL